MAKDEWRCTMCSYLYEPRKGDRQGGIPRGTAFKDLPDTWVCPLCGVGKEQFEEEVDWDPH